MNAAFTPGPWRVEEGTTLVWGNCNPDDRTTYGMGYPVASAEQPRTWSRQKPSEAEREANARLIAAAPDLYEALEKTFICICQNCPLGPTNDRTAAGELIDSLRVLLASHRQDEEAGGEA